MAKGNRKPPPRKPGRTHQHLIDNYSDPPGDGNLKNGHVLAIYCTHLKSVAQTLRAVVPLLPPAFTTNANHIRTLGHRYESFKKPSRDTEWKNFLDLCNKQFKTVPVSVEEHVQQPVSPGPSQSSPSACETPSTSVTCETPTSTASVTPLCTSSPSQCSCSKTTPPFSLRERELSPQKKALKQYFKQKLNFVSKQRRKEQNKYSRQINNLKAKLNVTKYNEIKYLNQDIKRKQISIKAKNAKLAILKKQLKETDPGAYAEQLKEQQRKHKRLIKSNKEKRKSKRDSVPLSQFVDLKNECKAKDETIRALECEKLELEEKLEEMKCSNETQKEAMKDKKTYNSATRMMVYDALMNNVPTQNIPNLIESHCRRTGQKMTTVPQRTTVENMARELDIISDLKTADMVMKNQDLTLAFDATTQEGTHINSIHITSKTCCSIVSVEELPGGTADDYSEHVCSSVDHLAKTYASFHQDDYQFCRSTMITNISNTMTDRASVNHATVEKVCSKWNKKLNELNCHLHPLDTISTECRSALKALESTQSSKGHLYGNDCTVGNLVVQINKFRYKDSKGDPKGFKVFLSDNNLPKGYIPRYRGNRLHVLFHICGKLHHSHSLFLDFFTKGNVSCGGLQGSIRKDFASITGRLQMQCIGLLGKHLSGPWMQVFYTSADCEINHIEGVNIVQNVISALRKAKEKPLDLLKSSTDFFGRDLSSEDETLASLQKEPENLETFRDMLTVCLNAVIAVLERQYKKYFEKDITAQLQKETESARMHNIDAEEIMGMYSSGKERSKNATIDFLAARMKAKKNKVVEYLDSLYEDKRNHLIDWAITNGRLQRKRQKQKQSAVHQELSRRAAAKRQKKTEGAQKKLTKQLKTVDIKNISTEFPDLSAEIIASLKDILSGNIIGRDICHTWYDSGTHEQSTWNGRIEKLKKKRDSEIYQIAYWAHDESYEDDATDYDISKWELAADLIMEDVIFC